MTALLIDIAGVLTDGGAAVPGAHEAFRRLRDAQVPFRLITNTTRRSKRVLIDELASEGFEVGPDEVFTPAQAAVVMLQERNLSPHLLIHPDLEEDFADCPPSGSVAVVVGDAGRHFDYDRLNAAFRLIANGAAFLALARNRAFKDSDGCLSMDAGAFVCALEYSSGQTPVVLGKPARSFFETAVRSMGCTMAEVAMIGDDAEADVAGALKAGIEEAYLVRTGKYSEEDELQFRPSPTATVSSFTEAVSAILD
jgi:HAD superfamily hydrolase (TIGR01458 family)